MNTAPTPPSPGKPVSAGFFTRLIGWVKSGMIIEGQGYRLHRGPNGTVLDIDIAKAVKPAASLPWSFTCSEDADTHVRTGGWGNGLAQFGYDRLFVTPDLESVHRLNATTITGTDTTDDGFHYLEVDTLNATAEIKVDENGFPPHDPTRGILRIGLGLVEDGKLVSGFHHNPVIYKYV